MFGVNQLLPRNCYPEYLATIVASGVTGQSTPAAANVQQAEAGSEMQPLTNPIQLPQLRRSEVVALGEERTGILHIRIEHCFEKIVTHVVMHPAYFSGAPASLLVQEPPVMHLYVPGASAVDPNVGTREKIAHHILGFGHMIQPIAGAFGFRLTNRARCGE
jgi:hypothetical protein